MIHQITALESCWHISPEWGQTMPPLAVRMLEKVLLPISDLSGYCCGVLWEKQEWIYAIVCQNETLYLAEQEFHRTNLLEKSTVSTPAFKLGDIIEVDFGEQPTRRVIQGIFSLKDNWLYGVEWRSPILEELSAQSRTCRASVIDDLQGILQYCPTLTQASLKPSTRFFSTVLIEAFDHKLMAIIRQITR